MASLTQPLRNEHRDLRPHIESLHLAADAVGTASPERLQQQVEEAYAFLTQHLIPHAYAEDEALYPVVARLMGAPEATATMRRDHVEVGRLTEELNSLRRELATSATPTPELEQALRRVLYGLYAVVTLHFAKEEEVYLPLLDTRLTPDAARTMFTAMEVAAHNTAALG